MHVPYSAESVLCWKALGQPGFTNLAKSVAPFGVMLSDLTHTVMVGVANMQDGNSLNGKNSTPFEMGMQEDPLILSTVHQQQEFLLFIILYSVFHP